MSGADRFFVDSNVLLYCVDGTDPEKQSRALDWLDHLWLTGSGRLSWQVLHEFYWNAVRKMRIEPASARGIVEDLAHWKPVDTTFTLVQNAWQWTDAAQLAYWDALVLAAAQHSGARYLLTEDFQMGRHYGDVLVVNPFAQSASDFDC